MESRNQPQAVKSLTEVKNSRFQIVKLEERIAPHKVCVWYWYGTTCLKHNQHG